MSFWKRLMGRRDAAVDRRAEAEQVESPAERAFTEGSVEDIASDEVVEERLGGFNPQSFVDDEFKP
jgi:hypothetical protein